LTAENGAEALDRFSRESRTDPTNLTAHVGRTAALVVLERWEEAEHAVTMAQFIADGGGWAISSRVHNELAYYRARVAYGLGDSSGGIDQLEKALDEIRNQSLSQLSSTRAETYGWGVFRRVGWARDTLPGLTTIRFTDREIAWLLTLGTWYEDRGDVDAASDIYREILNLAPDTEGARERLGDISVTSQY
jgi:tetratricopeptide (TPR) repeat protein